ncbi:MAG: histidine phosphatase family protein [Leptolyngbyaceae cyanobacterium bins.59]|nr:histidine phosphatase family protein [Leptolyngbyaceae cyanobacterium bins.59]
MTTRVILVRHGQSSYNVERRVQGHLDESTLTEVGQESARQVGAALKEITFDGVYSSPLRRARDTADLILAGLVGQTPPLHVTDNLKEINLVNWEGVLFKDVEAQDPEGFRHWQESPHELKMQVARPDGTTFDFFPVPALYDQARQFWRETIPNHPGQTLLVVAHSGINRALIGAAIGLTPADYQAIHQSNCGISVLNFPDGWTPESAPGTVQVESSNLTSHMDEPLPKPRHNHKGPRFLLVRHGETDWNRQKRFQGQIDVPLNDNGRNQARQAAEFLKDVKLDFAFSSPMLRPKETAEIILEPHPQVQLGLCEEFCEISHGLWEGKLEEEIKEVYPDLLVQWQKQPATVQMPEGENLQQVWDRTIAGWQKILKTVSESGTQATVLVVAHDAVNKAILCYMLGLGAENFWNFRQGNGAVSVIDYPNGPDQRPVLQALNITTHLAGGVLDKTAAGAL